GARHHSQTQWPCARSRALRIARTQQKTAGRQWCAHWYHQGGGKALALRVEALTVPEQAVQIGDGHSIVMTGLVPPSISHCHARACRGHDENTLTRHSGTARERRTRKT